MKTCPAVLLGAVLFLAPAVQAEVTPDSSKPRAEKMDRWRVQISAAEEAAGSGQTAEAERLYRDLLEQAENAEDRGLLTARATDGLADICRAQRRLEEARQFYARSAAMWERLLGPRQPRLGVTLHNLAVVEAALGDVAAAEEHLLQAIGIFDAALGTESAQAVNSRATYEQIRRRERAGL
jgi:tetratricopeptide (TPR) repeat protein